MHVVYLESPAGVGFSETNEPEQKNDDSMTGKAHHASLVDFLKQFTDYKFKELYIAGISYAGVYVPYLVAEIYSNADIGVPLKRILIGNGLTDRTVDIERSMVDFGYLNVIISPELKRELDLFSPIIDDKVINDF